MKNLLHSFEPTAELRGRWRANAFTAGGRRAGALTIGTTF